MEQANNRDDRTIEYIKDCHHPSIPVVARVTGCIRHKKGVTLTVVRQTDLMTILPGPVPGKSADLTGVIDRLFIAQLVWMAGQCNH